MIIAVDFDGTIVEHAYPEIGREIPFAIETLKQLQKDGHLIILWSVREGRLLEEAVDYCASKGLEFYAVNASMPDEIDKSLNTRKVNVELFIDDRNLGGLPEWGIIYQMIKSGNPFRPYSGLQNEYPTKPKKSLLERIFG